MPRGFGVLLAACVAVGAVDAAAQTFTDPLQPSPDGDPKKPARFEKFKNPNDMAPLGARSTFTPPVSGKGTTGFDSSNAKKKKAAKMKPKPGVIGAAAPTAVSPYQRPQIPPAAADAMAAGPPGTPPYVIGPIETVPKKRKHKDELDPYDPLGVHAGAFMLYPAVELIGGYDTNPQHVPGGKSSSLYTVAPELKARSDWSRHELTADLRGSYSYYKDDGTPSLNRPFADGKVKGRVDVTHNTRIDLGGRLLAGTDNPGSPNLPADISKLPMFTTFGGDAGITHRFNRLDLGVKGTAERTIWQNSKLVDGSTASNQDRNYDQYGGAVRAGYELSPGLVPFVDVGADTRLHDLATDFSGYQRNSKGLTAKAGSTFELSRLLTGDFSVGVTKRDYVDTRLQQLKGIVADASLVWTASALTTVKLTAASTIGESTVPGVSGVFYRDAGLQVDHALRRWLIGTVKFGFGLDEYVGDIRKDNRTYVGAGLTYKLNRSVQIKGEFRQDWLRSNVTGVDYTSSVFLLGLRFAQ